jgi:hypothetical protein
LTPVARAAEYEAYRPLLLPDTYELQDSLNEVALTDELLRGVGHGDASEYVAATLISARYEAVSARNAECDLWTPI